MSWLDALGWAGSALLIYSLLQARVLRFRVLNLVASLVLVLFNALLGIWPMVAMNLVLAGINVWFIAKLLGERHDETAYEVLEVAGSDAYLQHVLRVHDEDIRGFFPAFTGAGSGDDRSAFLVQRGDETVGVVLVRDAGGGVAQVELDYVTPRFRDFTPGEFVYRRSGLFRDLGFQPGAVAARHGRPLLRGPRLPPGRRRLGARPRTGLTPVRRPACQAPTAAGRRSSAARQSSVVRMLRSMSLSRPTENRMSPSVSPIACRSSGGISDDVLAPGALNSVLK